MRGLRWLCGMFVMVGLLGMALTPVAAQGQPIRNCVSGAFSTEEDFMSDVVRENPYVSDGDLLSLSGQVCARNSDLLQRFDVQVDLGLDAVHIVDFGDFGEPLIAFSTELDSPFGTFSAGDILFTSGAIIPNNALVLPFDVRHDVGLDGLQLFGEPERIRRLTEDLPPRDDDVWNNGFLQERLREFGIEIWFSTEGTVGDGQPVFLDGDILSADGTVIARNSDLLPGGVPAGIPDRGVDFGTDAIAVLTRPGGDDRRTLFSTEILFNGRELSFTDGDVLQQGDGIVITNENLVAAFKPRADFLGLDALWLPDGVVELTPVITTMCERDVNNFNGGLVLAGDAGAYTGLYRANSYTAPPGDDPRRPCGLSVPIDGPRSPLSAMNRFRVAYRPNGAPVPAVGTAPAIQTRWYLPVGHWDFNLFTMSWNWVCPEVNISNPATYQILETDPNGWMDASDFLNAESGALTGCTPPELRLAVWNSASIPPADPSFNPDGQYIIWLEWEDGGGMHRENADHHVQLDNTAPEIAPYPDGLQIRLMDGETIIPACGEVAGETELQVWGQFFDEHYWYFTLSLYGGNPPSSWSSSHNYYDADDGTPGVKNTGDDGTTPPGQPVHLRNIDMTVLGESFVDCCYMLQMYVYDAAILHSFDGTYINQYSLPHQSGPAFITFSAAP